MKTKIRVQLESISETYTFAKSERDCARVLIASGWEFPMKKMTVGIRGHDDQEFRGAGDDPLKSAFPVL